ncbi:MAG: cytochrome b N-terminal domain-containing protein [Rubrivivax sp.]
MTPATLGARAVRRAERALDRWFGLRANPLRQLGAWCFWLLWIVVASGFWIYVLYETSVEGAWASVDAMRLQPWGAGLGRSLHRYASDALVVVTTLHALREWLLGRHRGTRWFAWVSGVPLLWLLPASGLVGYWMVWDRRAQYAGTALLEWATTLPGVALESVRNLLDPAAVTDRFFSLLSFLHIGAPLLLLLGSWVHLLRLKDPLTQPRPRGARGALAVLVAGAPGAAGALDAGGRPGARAGAGGPRLVLPRRAAGRRPLAAGHLGAAGRRHAAADGAALDRPHPRGRGRGGVRSPQETRHA